MCFYPQSPNGKSCMRVYTYSCLLSGNCLPNFLVIAWCNGLAHATCTSAYCIMDEDSEAISLFLCWPAYKPHCQLFSVRIIPFRFLFVKEKSRHIIFTRIFFTEESLLGKGSKSSDEKYTVIPRSDCVL